MVTKNQMGTLFKQAITTFTCKKELFYQNLELLRAILDRTTAQDLNMPSRLMDAATWNVPNKAPVTYIEVYEDSNVSIGVFILKPGMKLPLHDHPGMHGLIKVIGGLIKITSFSLNTPAISQYLGDTTSNTVSAEKGSTSTFFGSTGNGDSLRMTVVAEQMLSVTADVSNESCLLEPDIGNIHEVENVGPGPAAFLDILSPPYDTSVEDVGERKCTYFKVMKQLSPNIFQLLEVGAPKWYWNDSLPYTGPKLTS